MRLLALCLVVAMAACTSSAETPTETTLPPGVPPISVDLERFVVYESPAYGFSIAYPDDWTVDEVPAENLVGFTAPQSGGSALTPNFNMTVSELPDGIPAVVLYEGEVARVQEALRNVDVLEVVDVNVDGVLGRGLTAVTRQSDLDIGISRIVVVDEGRFYELTFLAQAADLQALAPLVTAIFQSVRLLN